MKAMILKQFGRPLAYEEAPEPKIGPHQVLVESKANGLCATDFKDRGRKRQVGPHALDARP